MMLKKINLIKIVPNIFNMKQRLDKVLVFLFKKYSRTFLKKLVLIGFVFVDGIVICDFKKKIIGGEIIRLFGFIDEYNINKLDFYFSVKIVYEDKEVLIINKPVDLVVHPAPGYFNSTLLNLILLKYKYLINIPRAGILHRLDKNTTGLIIIAKNLLSYFKFKNLFISKKICREYIIFIFGKIFSGGTINLPIGKHSFKRNLMIVNYINGKNSVTHFRIIKRSNLYTNLRVFLETGRTHQIRVHFLYKNFPIIGDQIYNKKNLYFKNIQKKKIFSLFPRQAMHAQTLRFFHPNTKQLIYISSSLPGDMRILRNFLKKNF